ncbi:hypothetical protein TBLA_0E04700 [Henningerozyma blattae CBS 6284]|uniref:Uncharacterized protein n=1 Tax=Henningerozyma blattae (strain ATCC 34711 / CBS 6284 / DSM 70876 / NBRC 10599 / NRRL Y-10934 / UCD 77-7) TaxID=1071380 RepID=I2H570_HENB6|nr:hypothetical protein TBLA_0E04700 [Tetrapisispora blattae CBS 6284]CCH61522.1 hypothetical protein TBLA_0E04700 [Tetrapisispora blattae CBS 6284]
MENQKEAISRHEKSVDSPTKQHQSCPKSPNKSLEKQDQKSYNEIKKVDKLKNDIFSDKWLKGNKKEEIISQMMKNDILQKIEEMNKIMDNETERLNTNLITLDGVENKIILQDFDWDSVIKLSADLMDEYFKKIENLSNKHRLLLKKHEFWKEAAFSMDNAQASMMLEESQNWIINKEFHLKYKNHRLINSVKAIKLATDELEVNE